MSTMSLEVHVNTRGKMVPNPEEDEVQCIFWCFSSDENALRGSQSPDGTQSGIVRDAAMQDVPNNIFHRVLKKIQLASHGSPNIDHVSARDTNGRCCVEAPFVSFFANPSVRLRLHA